MADNNRHVAPAVVKRPVVVCLVLFPELVRLPLAARQSSILVASAARRQRNRTFRLDTLVA